MYDFVVSERGCSFRVCGAYNWCTRHISFVGVSHTPCHERIIVSLVYLGVRTVYAADVLLYCFFLCHSVALAVHIVFSLGAVLTIRKMCQAATPAHVFVWHGASKLNLYQLIPSRLVWRQFDHLAFLKRMRAECIVLFAACCR